MHRKWTKTFRGPKTLIGKETLKAPRFRLLLLCAVAQQVPTGDYSYSIPSGAVLNNAAAYDNGRQPRRGRPPTAASAVGVAASAAASPPTNYDAPQSVDSGFASDYPLCSPMPSPMGDNRYGTTD